MSVDWSVWGPPLAVLGAGLMAGAFVAARGGGAGRPAGLDAEREALVARKRMLLEQVVELDAERAKLGDAEWARRRDALIDRAAKAVRDLDRLDRRRSEPKADEPPRPTSIWRRVGWTVLAVGFFGLLGFAVVHLSTRKGEGMGARAASASAGGDGDRVQEYQDLRQERASKAKAALARNPNDLQALNALTHEALMERDVAKAMNYLEQARKLDASDPEVLTHLASLQITVGMTDQAKASLAQALMARPDFPEALFWRAVIAYQAGDTDAAKADANKVIQLSDLHTAEGIEAHGLAASLLDAIENPEPAGAGGGMAALGERASSASAGPARVSGQVTLAEGAKVPEGGILFVHARRGDGSSNGPVTRGPPLAAWRKVSPELPVDFSLGDADLIMGGSWPDEVWLQARMDSDGDPMTHSPTDLVSEIIGPISPGTAGIELILAPVGR